MSLKHLLIGYVCAGALIVTCVPLAAQAPRPRPGLSGNPIEDIKNAVGGGGTQSGGGGSTGNVSPLDRPFQALADFIGDDIDAAIALSTQIPTLQDGNGQQCLIAFKEFGEVIKAHPAPLTFKIASDLEAFRLKQMAVNRLCASDACDKVFSDISQTITALSPVPLPIPNLHDLCSKVPTIKVVPPVAVATPPIAPNAPASQTPPTSPP